MDFLEKEKSVNFFVKLQSSSFSLRYVLSITAVISLPITFRSYTQAGIFTTESHAKNCVLIYYFHFNKAPKPGLRVGAVMARNSLNTRHLLKCELSLQVLFQQYQKAYSMLYYFHHSQRGKYRFFFCL